MGPYTCSGCTIAPGVAGDASRSFHSQHDPGRGSRDPGRSSERESPLRFSYPASVPREHGKGRELLGSRRKSKLLVRTLADPYPLIPLTGVQFYVQSAALLVGLWPLAYEMWRRPKAAAHRVAVRAS
jgi:hypothetical protein